MTKHTKPSYREGCRCDPCKKAHRERQYAQIERRHDALLLDPSIAPHGSRSTYNNYRCRCEPCSDAQAAYSRKRRHG